MFFSFDALAHEGGDLPSFSLFQTLLPYKIPQNNLTPLQICEMFHTLLSLNKF